MSSFVFPPPPPPPPKASVSQATASQSNDHGGRGRGHQRGRSGRNNFRGSSRGRGGPKNASFGNGHNRGQPFQNGSMANPSDAANDTSRKRKWNGSQDLTGGIHQRAKIISKQKVEVAPAVPSFGFSLPVVPVAASGGYPLPATSLTDKRSQRRKTNQLGLTPQGDMREESEEEDIDEEAAFSAKGLPANLRVEYKGRVYELGTPEGMKNWLEERKKNWPTRAKVDEKNREALKQKQDALRRRLEKDQARKRAQQNQYTDQAAKDAGPTNAMKKKSSTKDTQAALEKHLAKAEKLRQKLRQFEAENGDTTLDNPIFSQHLHEDKKNGNLGGKTPLESRGQQQGDLESGELKISQGGSKNSIPSSESSSTLSDSESDSDSDSSSALSDDDGRSNSAPEQASSKVEMRQPAPLPTRDKPQKVCRDFASTRRCRWGSRCHFKHETKSSGARSSAEQGNQAQSSRKSLYQRLVEQEQETENRLALQAIKHLGQQGLLK